MKLKAGLDTAKNNIKTKRYLPNYFNDIVAGNISRTPVYASIDNIFLGVGDEQVIGSMANSLGASVAGWSLLYTLGNSMLASIFGETYQKNAKKIDATYSAIMTFGFGMAVNLAAGYTPLEAGIASSLRAVIAIPLGPITRSYTDSFREARDEPNISGKETKFKDKNWGYKIPRLAAMIAVPLALVTGSVMMTPDKKEMLEVPVQTLNQSIKKTDEVLYLNYNEHN